MAEYNKSIEELLNDFKNLQLTEIIKQVNMQLVVPIGGVAGNTLNNYEQAETSNPF